MKTEAYSRPVCW